MRFIARFLMRAAIKIHYKRLLNQRKRIAEMYAIRDSIVEIQKTPGLEHNVAVSARVQYNACIELIRDLENAHRDLINEVMVILDEYEKMN